MRVHRALGIIEKLYHVCLGLVRQPGTESAGVDLEGSQSGHDPVSVCWCGLTNDHFLVLLVLYRVQRINDLSNQEISAY